MNNQSDAFTPKSKGSSSFKLLWLPFLIGILCLLLMTLPVPWGYRWIWGTAWMVYLGVLGWFLSLMVKRFWQRQFKQGWRALMLFFLSIIAGFPVSMIGMFMQMAFPKDGFADDLKLPEGVALAEPAATAPLPDTASLMLANANQPGMYHAQIRCNPGMPGKVYLKAFEMTRNYSLSKDSLKQSTHQKIGWSENPKEQFLSESRFFIYEGDWDQFYGTRFEVWFEPDNGGPERKLLEKSFKIQGWMN